MLVDHRASPGLPGLPQVFEAATLTCAHCKTVAIKNPDRTRERGHCFRCNSYICDACAALKRCRPWAQVVDELLDGKTPVPLLASDMKE